MKHFGPRYEHEFVSSAKQVIYENYNLAETEAEEIARNLIRDGILCRSLEAMTAATEIEALTKPPTSLIEGGWSAGFDHGLRVALEILGKYHISPEDKD